jgi:cell division transport system permease protein
MKLLLTAFKLAGRNFRHTWSSQIMTLLTVGLSVLIFSFFFLIYINFMKAGVQIGGDLRLVVYLEEEPPPEMLIQLKNKINAFSETENIIYVSRQEAFERLTEQLGGNEDMLANLDPLFLPPSIEVYPKKNLKDLAQIELFSHYLHRLPGAVKVQYGQDWIERFNYFTKLLRIIVLLSGGLLILTTTFMVAYTVRLSVVARQAELKILKLLGATNNYIRTPFLLEGLLQGFLGSTLGLLSLQLLFEWIKKRFSTATIFDFFEFTFFSSTTIGLILAASIILCISGSISSMRKFLQT